MNIVAYLLMVCATYFPGAQSGKKRECASFVVECSTKNGTFSVHSEYNISVCFAEKLAK